MAESTLAKPKIDYNEKPDQTHTLSVCAEHTEYVEVNERTKTISSVDSSRREKNARDSWQRIGKYRLVQFMSGVFYWTSTIASV